MRGYFFLFLFSISVASLYLLFPIQSKKGFITLESGKFKLNGKDFYPVAVNYITSIQANKNNIWICPYKGYFPDSKFSYMSSDSCFEQLKADMFLIKELGFNTVRIVGAGEESVNKFTGQMSVYAHIGNERDTSIIFSNDSNYEKYFNAINELFNAANEAGLKIIFLTKLNPEVKSTEYHIRRLAERFKNDTSILAYDLFNEPLYFDSVLTRTKEEVHQIAKRWNKIVKMYAPNQLTTIGLASVREIFRWDPNTLDVDFISLHPYEVEPDQVRNEIYWYGHHIKKPWIIGETGIPADNDSVSYKEQKNFAHKTLMQAYNCGASGYSWWQYKEVEWYAYHANYLGVVTRKGETKPARSKISVQGTVKPVAEEFKKYNPAEEKDSCLCLSNYYNWSQHNKFRIKGNLADTNNISIQGGVVLGWNEYWSHSYHTITKEDGSFELMSDFPFYHWIASATLHSVTRGDIFPDTAKKYSDSIPTINLGDIKLQKLDL